MIRRFRTPVRGVTTTRNQGDDEDWSPRLPDRVSALKVLENTGALAARLTLTRPWPPASRDRVRCGASWMPKLDL